MPRTRNISSLSLEGARLLAAAGEAEAVRRGWTAAIAVVDPDGGLILFLAIDGTQPASLDIAIAKARTAARFRRPTKVMEDGVAGGRHVLLSVPNALMLEGGVPVKLEGRIVGAIGVSGMTSAEDGVIAAAALAAWDGARD
ncbi:MAG TPA: heme-binding protein [Gemmatimonadales bacterium]|nr:heme-binding protein [Gemmatimonadales bacterium]